MCYRRSIQQHLAARRSGSCGGGMAFVHHTMLTAENLRGMPRKQLHTNVVPHFSPRSRAAQGNLGGVGGVGVYSGPVIGLTVFCPLSGFRHCPSVRLNGLFQTCLNRRSIFLCSSLWGSRRPTSSNLLPPGPPPFIFSPIPACLFGVGLKGAGWTRTENDISTRTT